jgi:hypothetical protein
MQESECYRSLPSGEDDTCAVIYEQSLRMSKQNELSRFERREVCGTVFLERCECYKCCCMVTLSHSDQIAEDLDKVFNK